MDWFHKADKNARVDNDSMLFYSKKMQSSANSPCEYINGLTFEANAIYFKRDCNASKKICEKILKKIDKEASSLNDSCFYHLKAKTLGRLMYAEKCLGNYTEALKYITKSQNLNKDYKKYSSLYTVQSLYQSALIYVALEKYSEAIKQFKNITSKAEKHTTKLLLPSIYMAVGDSYLKLHERSLQKKFLDSAKIYFKNYREITTKINTQKTYSQKLYEIKKGIIALHEKKFKDAILHLQKAKNIKLSEEKPFTMQEIAFYKAKAFYHLNYPDSTIYYATKFLKKHNLFPKNSTFRMKGHSLLAKAYEDTEKLTKALYHSSMALSEAKRLDTLKFNGIEKLNLINLKKAKQKQQILIDKRRKKWFAFFTLFVTTIVLSLLLFQFYKFREKRKKSYSSFDNSELKKENNIPLPIQVNATSNTSVLKINDDIIHKILLGLEKIEKEKTFLKTDFNLQYIANEVNSNISYVSKVINFHKKKSFKEYTNTLRIEHIIKELKEKPITRQFSIDAIAKELGYSNASSFSKIFKKNTGINPSVFIHNLNDKL